jgi:hypothetical protein
MEQTPKRHIEPARSVFALEMRTEHIDADQLRAQIIELLEQHFSSEPEVTHA